MPSFDIVSEVNVQEVDNAVNQAQKEIQSRYDFKGTKFDISFDSKTTEIKLNADAESRLESMLDILNSKLIKRGIELGSVDVGKREAAGGMMMKQTLKIKQGLEQDKAKQIIKAIKDSKLKVEAQIQDKQVRVSGKKIDDLQEVIALLKGQLGQLKVPLQFINMRS
ncbi:MAG: YajQ family cyclic di-GMP-binding protein [Proteobacteria bacterium]|nr:YajQ family cyclic di-GMP-binding protein [Pseudomonadota bacterium]